MNVQFGQLYNVPCVPWKKYGKKVWVPILGDRHPDPELHNPRPHYHIDYRFMTDNFMRWLNDGEIIVPTNIKVLGCPNAPLSVTRRRLRCCRQFYIIHPGLAICGHINGVDLEKFEGMMEKSQVVERDGCKFCPHKGIPLEGGAELLEGVVECPGHGLAWNMATGKLYKRAMPCE